MHPSLDPPFPLGSHASLHAISKALGLLILGLVIPIQPTLRGEETNATALFEKGQQEEANLDLFGARKDFLAALKESPELPGLKEHTAWFLYLNGFHTPQCLGLFKEILASTTNSTEVSKAIEDLRRERSPQAGIHAAASTTLPPPRKTPPAVIPEPWDRPARLQYARELFWVSMGKESVGIYEELLRETPDESALLLEIARVEIAMDQFEKARKHLEKAKSLNPDEPEIKAELATLQTVRENAHLKSLLLATPSPAPRNAPAAGSPSPLPSGEHAEARLDLFGARDIYRRALSEHPNQQGLMEHAAWFFYLNGFHDSECLRFLEETKATASSPEAVSKAITQLKQELGLSAGEKSTAFKRPAPCSEQAPLNKRLQYARELLWSGDPDAALSSYDALVIQLPEEPAIRLERARVEIALKKYREAESDLKIARTLRPDVPEIALEQSRLEALRGNRTRALAALEGVKITDEGTLHLARARAYHYFSGEFPEATREYRAALKCFPYSEEAAFGLTETSLRSGAVPESRSLLSSSPSRFRAYDWSDRIELERNIAAPRIKIGGDYVQNNIHYQNFDAGTEFRYRPIDPLELTLDTTHGWYNQTGFNGIERQTSDISVIYQKNESWAVSGNVGVNGYTSGWTSVNAGVGLMVRPISSLKFELRADHLDVVDSEPPLGIALYDLTSTIGGVGSRSSMNMLSVASTWTPLERLELFGKYRAAVITSANTFQDYYFSGTYSILKDPKLKVGYSLYHEDLLNPAPLYRQNGHTTSAYYDPRNLLVHGPFIQWSQNLSKQWEYGLQGQLCQQPQNGGLAVLGLTYVKFSWRHNQAVRLDANVVDQNRGLTRSGGSSGRYEATNIIVTYAYTF